MPTSPARLGAVRVRIARSPTFNSPWPAPAVSLGFPLRPYSPPCDFRQPGLSQCCSGLVWQRKWLLTGISPKSPVAGPARGWGAWGCSCPGPRVGPKDLFFLKLSPYLLFSQCPLYFFVPYLHKHWATFGCSLCFSVKWVGISPRCQGKLTPLPPISWPSSLCLYDYY